MLHPWIVGRVGVHGRAAVIDGLGAQLVVPGLVAVDPAQPVRGAVLGQPRRGIGGPDVDRVARHVRGRVGGGHPAGGLRLASRTSRPPRGGAAPGTPGNASRCRRRARRRRPRRRSPRGAGRRAGRGRGWRRPEPRRRRPSCRRGRHRRPRQRAAVLAARDVRRRGGPVEGDDAGDWWPSAAAIAATTTSRTATRGPANPGPAGRRRAGALEVTPPVKAAACCRRVCGFRYAGDMRRLVASEHARAARRGRALHGGGHPRRPAPGGDRGRHRR